MFLSALIRTAVVATTLGMVSVAVPALAEAPTAVSFPDHNPWAQVVASVTRSDASHDYTVAVAAGKTLQINLVTRNPNVFFQVRDGSGKLLIDSYTTGATTWSTQVATAATYAIHVYIQPDAIARGDEAKYALQIGQYGQADMQAAVTPVTFEAGKPWVQAVGTLDAQGTTRDYEVAIPAGETFAVNLISREAKVHFKVIDKATGRVLVDSAQSGSLQWSAQVSAPARFTVSVYADPSAMPPGTRVGYAIQIGHYGQVAPPAGAASAAAPATPGAPAAAASAAGPAAARS